MRNRFPTDEIYAEALKRLNNLAEYRRLRIFAGNDTVPPLSGWSYLLAAYQYFVHLFLRNEKHQGTILDRSVAYGNDHDDFVFDICP